MIDTQTVEQPTITTMPRDAKPSEIVRTLADDFSYGCLRWSFGDGPTIYCAAGALLEESGFSWGEPIVAYPNGTKYWDGWATTAMEAHLTSCYGLSRGQVLELQITHDDRGKDAAADLLESWGL